MRADVGWVEFFTRPNAGGIGSVLRPDQADRRGVLGHRQRRGRTTACRRHQPHAAAGLEVGRSPLGGRCDRAEKNVPASAIMKGAYEVFLPLLALVAGFCFVVDEARATSDISMAAAMQIANRAPIQAAACANTVEQFVQELDAVLSENPRSIVRYDALLAKYFSLKNGVPGLPSPLREASAEGCVFEEIVEIAKKSRFFYEAAGPPLYASHRIEFRNASVKVSFALSTSTGNIIGPLARWLFVYP